MREAEAAGCLEFHLKQHPVLQHDFLVQQVNVIRPRDDFTGVGEASRSRIDFEEIIELTGTEVCDLALGIATTRI